MAAPQRDDAVGVVTLMSVGFNGFRPSAGEAQGGLALKTIRRRLGEAVASSVADRTKV